MRIPVAVVGMLVMFMVAVGVLFLGILGFTPVQKCTGACMVPFTMTLVGTFVIGLSATFATWFRALRAPRAYWPWIGAGLMVVLYLVALAVADQVL
ncbi:hypothetical protein FXN61_10160 [Lentzea sp. PSKA42]|jgi:hypothetical protein|uniref:Uncharacterized protein n=1 Tax=Lentzea indica TaxID=2604800 RepID=A0ABX1FEY2_9PSEU|nr:hypothetical protein [Lentzea indica]NKE57178.1 hypothetical protein [Lentzea indica]